MATTLPSGIKKWDATDPVNRGQFNEQWETIDGIVEDKVDKVSGKGLSENDYTDAEKAKVAAALPKDEGVNKISDYTPVGIDPNTTTSPHIVTNHANCPPGPIEYWRVLTFFYESVTNNRSQIALSYTGGHQVMEHRKFYNNAWTDWRTVWDSGNDGTGSGLIADYVRDITFRKDFGYLEYHDGTGWAKPDAGTIDGVPLANLMASRPAPGNVDWNTLTTPGTYQIGQATAFTSGKHQPVGAKTYGVLNVFGTPGQIVHEYHPHSTSGEVRVSRVRYDGVWSPWKAVGGNVNVQRGTTSISSSDGSPKNIAINSVDLSKASANLLTGKYEYDGYTVSGSMEYSLKLTSPTNLAIEFYGYGYDGDSGDYDEDITISWEVIEHT